MPLPTKKVIAKSTPGKAAVKSIGKPKQVIEDEEDDEDEELEEGETEEEDDEDEEPAPKPKAKLKLTKAVPKSAKLTKVSGKAGLKVTKKVAAHQEDEEDDAEETEEVVSDTEETVEGTELTLSQEELCKAGVKAGITLPIPGQKFASFRYDVWIEMPCVAENVDSTFEFAKDWVEDRLNGLVDANS